MGKVGSSVGGGSADVGFLVDSAGRELVIGGVYRHFKGKRYEVVGVAEHSETGEKLVVYRALYGEGEAYGKLYVRPMEMFLSEVDHEKYPEVEQRWRFEEEGQA